MVDPLTALVAKAIVSYGIKKELDRTIDAFKNPDDIESNLLEVIHNTIDEYSKDYPIPRVGKNFPFYESKSFLEELLKHQIFNQDGYEILDKIITSVLKDNPNIIKPKGKQIDLFLEIFKKHINNNEKLLSLAIKDDTTAIRKDTKEIKNTLKDGLVKPLPKELTALVKIPKDDIIGREKDLADLRKSLEQKNETALINGMGGIGKTTLAAVYISEFYNDYDHIVWLTIENTLEEAIISNTRLLKNLNLRDENPKEQFDLCLNELSTLESKKNLLVLDNAHQSLAEHYDKLPKKPNWHVLVTSRERIANFHIMDLDFLKEPEAIKLFKKHNTDFSDDDVKKIVNSVELHTLTIEILAKSAQKNRWSIETIKTALSKDAKAGVTTKHSNKQIKRIKSYLTSIFNISNLNEQETYLLKQFTALPNQWLEYDFLSELLQPEKLPWREDFAATLEDLYEKGFILKSEDKIKKIDSYKMHPILVESLTEHLNTTSEDLKLLSESIIEMLSFDNLDDKPKDIFFNISLAESLLKQLSGDTSTDTAILQNKLAYIYRMIGKLKEAGILYDLALESNIINFDKEHTNVALAQSDSAIIYRESGNYKKARDLMESALTIFIDNFSIDHIKVVNCQSELALIFISLHEFKQAKELLKQAIKTEIKNYRKSRSLLYLNLIRLAVVYYYIGMDKNEIDLWLNAYEVLTKSVGEQHHETQNIKGFIDQFVKGKFPRCK